MSAAAELQATCFHEPPPLGFLTTWSLYLFRVSDSLQSLSEHHKHAFQERHKFSFDSQAYSVLCLGILCVLSSMLELVGP